MVACRTRPCRSGSVRAALAVGQAAGGVPRLFARLWAAMGELVECQAEYQREEDVCGLFLDLLGTALGAKQTYLTAVATPSGPPEGIEAACGWQRAVTGHEERWLPKGAHLGWTDGVT